jgi:rod shape-determining protein MreD
MSLALLTILLYLAVIAQTTLLPMLIPLLPQVELVLIVGVGWTMRHTGWTALIGAVFAGLVADLASAGPLGPSVVALALAGVGRGRGRTLFGAVDSIGARSLTMFAVASATALVSYAAVVCLGSEHLPPPLALREALGSVLTTTLASIPLHGWALARRGSRRPAQTYAWN